jgi:hypothetical protein
MTFDLTPNPPKVTITPKMIFLEGDDPRIVTDKIIEPISTTPSPRKVKWKARLSLLWRFHFRYPRALRLYQYLSAVRWYSITLRLESTQEINDFLSRWDKEIQWGEEVENASNR